MIIQSTFNIFNAISEYDPRDATSVPDAIQNLKAKTLKPKPVKIGVPWHLFAEGLDPEVLENFKKSIQKLADQGYEIIEISLPKAKYSLAAYYILMPAEVSTNLSRFDGIRYGYSAEGKDLFEVYARSRGEGFGRETRRRIILGTYVLSHGYYDAYYTKALSVRDAITREFEDVFKNVDVIATPTSPCPAFKIGEKTVDPLAMYLSDIFTVPANISGIPAISIPVGRTKDGLPLDIQFMAPHFAEEYLFAIGKDFESLV